MDPLEHPKFGEMWPTLLHYLKKCNKPPLVAGSHKILIEADSETFKYTLLEGNEVLFSDTDLVKFTVAVKHYCSWEED
jgi:hypothetical protein